MNILYATDGSECAGIAGRLLTRLSLPADVRVTVLSAVPPPSWLAMMPLEGSAGAQGTIYAMLDEIAVEQKAAACRTAEDAAALLRQQGANASVCVRRQAPAEAILEEATEEEARLIVVGSHGMGAIEHLVIGSVSERVARYAHCSVLVARADTLKRAVVAVDGSESAGQALDAILRLPLPVDLEMILVYVRPPATLPPALQLGPGFSGGAMLDEYLQQSHALGEQIVRHAQAHLRHVGREATTGVRCGDPAEELIAAAREAGADLIVIGAANKSALGRLFLGSVSGRVLSHAPCSVMIARTRIEDVRAEASPADITATAEASSRRGEPTGSPA
jgi:nucleotide-binding universal stress UspA family protein